MSVTIFDRRKGRMTQLLEQKKYSKTAPGRFFLMLACLACLAFTACSTTEVQVRGQHDFAIGGVIRR